MEFLAKLVLLAWLELIVLLFYSSFSAVSKIMEIKDQLRCSWYFPKHHIPLPSSIHDLPLKILLPVLHWDKKLTSTCSYLLFPIKVLQNLIIRWFPKLQMDVGREKESSINWATAMLKSITVHFSHAGNTKYTDYVSLKSVKARKSTWESQAGDGIPAPYHLRALGLDLGTLNSSMGWAVLVLNPITEILFPFPPPRFITEALTSWSLQLPHSPFIWTAGEIPRAREFII